MLTLGGWTSARIAEAFSAPRTVRLWRSDFMSGGVDALKASVAAGPQVEGRCTLKVAEPLLSAPVANRPIGRWPALPRRSQAARGSQFPDHSCPRCCAKRGFRWRRPRHTLKGRQDPDAIDGFGLRLKLRKAQAEAGDLVLLFSDESEALTRILSRSRLGQARGADLRRASAWAIQEGRDGASGRRQFQRVLEDAVKLELLLLDKKSMPRSLHGSSRWLPTNTAPHDYWHVLVPGLRPGQVYAHGAHGTFDPDRGLRIEEHLLRGMDAVKEVHRHLYSGAMPT